MTSSASRYAGAAAMMAARESILQQPLDAAELHKYLTGLSVLGTLSADDLSVTTPPAASRTGL